MINVRVTMTGTLPLLQHNVRLANPLDRYAKELKAANERNKRAKTDEGYAEVSDAEFLGGLYWHESTGPYVPGEWVFASLVEGARLAKQGRKVERGVLIDTDGDRNPLRYDGPRDLEGLLADVNMRHMKAVKVGQARVMRTRPIFHNWSVTCPLLLDLEQLNFEELEQIAVRAGRFVAIGDFRPMFGRYDAVVEKV